MNGINRHSQNRKVFRRKEVARLIGVVPLTIDRWVSAGQFPKPIRLGRNSVGWLVTEIDAWLEARAVERDCGQVTNGGDHASVA